MINMFYKEFPKNSNAIFYHDGQSYNIQHNKYGYLVQVYKENGYYPVIQGKNSRRKKLSTINKYMKVYGIEFIENETT